MVKKFQIEKDYTQTPDVYFDSIMGTLTDGEWKVLSVIIRKTIGFGKISDRIAMSQILRLTGYTQRKSVLRVRKSLAEKGLISYDQSQGGNTDNCTEYTIVLPNGVSLVPVVEKTRVYKTNDTGVLNALTRVSKTTPTIDKSYNKQITTNIARADDNPLNRPRLKPNASALCVEAMDAFNSQILKRKAQPDYTMWPAWVALAGDEQAAFETVMGILHASKIPDGPRVPFSLDGVFRDPARMAYWRAQYKRPIAAIVHVEPDYEAQTMQELENMTDAERAARFKWYAQTGLIAPQEAVKKWKHLMPNLTQSQAS